MIASAADAIAFVIFRSESPGANSGLRNRMRVTSCIEKFRQSCAPGNDMQSAAHRGLINRRRPGVNDTILETVNLTREFSGFVAVDDVSLTVRTGTIHALIGPNGAGKTTCFNLLTAFLPPTRGTIRFKGRDITHMKPAQVARLGLVRSFQISAVFPHLTALENVRLALQRARGVSFDFWRSEKVLQVYDDRARELLFDVGLTGEADTVVTQLPYGQKRALEIATTLALDPEVMLLDEPTAGMGHGDVDRIVELIRRVRAGRTILMVEHNLSVVEGLCDIITVLTRGRVLAEGDYASVSANPDVIAAYLGTPHA
jgi:branched-chain amino acid transport system ATP-binding protein